MKQNYVVGLDIGTTKIAVIVGEKDLSGKVNILGYGRASSSGVQRGSVFNIDKTVESIKEAVEKAELMTGLSIKDVVVGIAGQHIHSFQTSNETIRTSQEEVTKEEVDEFLNRMRCIPVDAGEEVLHVIAQEFIIDGVGGIHDPVGMSGRCLAANFHIITGHASAIRNMYRCVHKAGLNMLDLILEPLASADAVLDETEREAGVVMVDIGGGTTDIAIIQDHILRHTAVIALGGDIITADIQSGCQIMKQQAELLKVKHGSTLPSEITQDAIISIPGMRGRPAKEISKKNLAGVIHARMEDIVDNISYHIENSGYAHKLIAGIVLTGGGSKLEHVADMIAFRTRLETRLGEPCEHVCSESSAFREMSYPGYATGVGLVIKGLEKFACQPPVKQQIIDPVKIDPKPEIPVEIPSETADPITETKKINKPKKSKRFSLNGIREVLGGLLEESDSHF